MSINNIIKGMLVITGFLAMGNSVQAREARQWGATNYAPLASSAGN